MSTVNPERLLIADDEPDLLTAYVLFFDAYGYEIQTAKDGLDALAQYRGWRPEIVVLDIQMPRLDGRAVAKEIRNLKAKPVPLLVSVSALSAPSELAGSIQSGFDHHFVKTRATAGYSGCDGVLATRSQRKPGLAKGCNYLNPRYTTVSTVCFSATGIRELFAKCGTWVWCPMILQFTSLNTRAGFIPIQYFSASALLPQGGFQRG